MYSRMTRREIEKLYDTKREQINNVYSYLDEIFNRKFELEKKGININYNEHLELIMLENISKDLEKCLM